MRVVGEVGFSQIIALKGDSILAAFKIPSLLHLVIQVEEQKYWVSAP